MATPRVLPSLHTGAIASIWGTRREPTRLASPLSALVLASCAGPSPPAASGHPATAPSTILDSGAGANAPAGTGAGDAGAPPDPSPCAGRAIDLERALSNAACYVEAPDGGVAPQLPPSVKVSLSTRPARLEDLQYATATLTLRNDGANEATIHFLLEEEAVALRLHLVDPRTLQRHHVGVVRFTAPTASSSRRARLSLAPGGVAIHDFCWRAERTTGRSLRLSPRNAVPLDPGVYQLVLWTELAGFASKDPDHERNPSTSVEIVEGRRCRVSPGDPTCRCPELSADAGSGP